MLKFNIVSYITILLLVGLIFLKASNWCFFTVLLCWFTFTIIGSFHIKWNYHLESLICNNEIQKNHIAITFDDGPNDKFTPQVLNLLKKFNVKATFFCVGKQVQKHPEIVQRIIAEGHVVGNHTFTHDEQFGFFNTNKVISELLETNLIIKETTGKDVKLFRPPFGVTNPRIKKALVKTNLMSIGWNVRSLDTTSKSVTLILSSIFRVVKKGDVILLHDTSEKSIDVLEQLLVLLDEKQLESVSIPTLFNINAYA